MKFHDLLPWHPIAEHLHPTVKRKSGAEGAFYGAAYGAVAAMASTACRDEPDPAKSLIAKAAFGAVLGVISGFQKNTKWTVKRSHCLTRLLDAT